MAITSGTLPCYETLTLLKRSVPSVEFRLLRLRHLARLASIGAIKFSLNPLDETGKSGCHRAYQGGCAALSRRC